MCLRMPFCGISSPSKAGTCCLRNPSSSFPFLKALPKHGETYSKKQLCFIVKVAARGLREWFALSLGADWERQLAAEGPGARSPWSPIAMGEIPLSVGRIFGGELGNIPAGCFPRGPLLQEKRGLNLVLDVTSLRFPGRGNRNCLRPPPIILSNCKQATKNPAPRAIPWSRIFIFSGDSIITLRPQPLLALDLPQ